MSSSLSDAKLAKLNELVGIHAIDIILALFLLVALILSAIAYGSLRTLGSGYNDTTNKAPTPYTNSKRSSLGLLIMVLLAMIFLAYDLFKKHKSVQTVAELSIKQLIRNRY